MDNSDIYGSFHLCENEFALSVKNVQEVINPPEKYTSVPLAPDYLMGLLNLRGMIIPVIDLRSILGFTDRAADEQSKIAIIEHNNCNIGLLFDRTGEIFRSNDSEKNDFDTSSSESIISGVFKKDDGKRIIQILDIHSVFKLKNIPIHYEGDHNQLRGSHALHRRRGSRRQCISFSIGPSKCSLSIDSIQEILKIDRLNESALAIYQCIGTIDLRGNTVPVIDFPALLGYRETDRSENATSGDRRVIVMRLGDEFFGLLVDAVQSIVTYFEDDLIKFPVLNHSKAEMFLGCISKENEDDLLLLNHEKVFSDQEINEITRGHSKLYKINNDERRKKLQSAGARKTYITFMLEHCFAISIGDVQEIIDYPEELLTPPGLPNYFRGILNLRGSLVTVVDTRAMYSMASKENQGKVLIFKGQHASYGLIVDSVDAIVNFNENEQIKIPSVVYQQSNSSLNQDVAEALEVNQDGKKKSLLILNLQAIAGRIESKQAA